MSGQHTHSGARILGVTHDAVSRPVGILMVIVGAIWALFSGMAAEAGTYGEPLAAVGLLVLGLLVAASGEPSESL
jgi:hypothetical protein